MIEYTIRLTLLSDGTPGAGLGTHAVQSLVARDAAGRPVVRASHLKGLVRDRLEWLAELGPEPPWSAQFEETLLGRGDDVERPGIDSRAAFHDLVAENATNEDIGLVTRTAIGDTGTVLLQSLRTTEVVAAGTVFSGTVRLDAEVDSALDLALRLGLRSIEAVGSGRSRGGGRCRIELERGEEGRLEETPGEVLGALLLCPSAEREPQEPEAPALAVPSTPESDSSTDLAWGVLRFDADGAICCPEAPAVGNVIRSGPCIPSSAIQGALITRLSEDDPAFATATLLDPRFRAWPLLPVARRDGVDDAAAGQVVTAARVDLAHRMSKIPDADGGHEFRDAAIEPYHWRDQQGGSPLKASDGVLLRRSDGTVGLWKSSDIPRDVTAHGVHSGHGRRARNLFTVEALAPLSFLGLVSMPRAAFDRLAASLEGQPHVRLGKARSVRGGGRLTLTRVSDPGGPAALDDHLGGEMARRVFVVQSPVAIPDEWTSLGSAEATLARIAAEAGWGEALLVSGTGDAPVARSLAQAGVRFGWNRHGHGATVGNQRRLRARRVILPGSVLVLKGPLDDVASRLRVGLGDGREQGYGVLLPHPGIASGRVAYRTHSPTVRASSGAAPLALELWELAHGSSGPSPSQIGLLMRRASQRWEAFGEVVEGLCQRSPRVRSRWSSVQPRLKQLAAETDAPRRAEALAALRVWHDLAVGGRDEQPGENA